MQSWGRNIKTKKGFLTYLLIIGLTISTFGALFNIQGANASGASWLSGWSYRKSHVIDNATSAVGTNYQVQITVYYGSGSDSGGSVYLNSLCKTNFGDIRFTASDGLTLLNYYMQSETDSNNAVFWVQDPDNLSSVNSTIYIYFGNSRAVTTSSGITTFNLFENATNNQWVDDSAHNPILTPTAGTWDAGGMWPLSCVYVSGTYYLYYTGSTTSSNAYTSGHIGVATSTDGIHFTKYSGNPIVSPTGSGWLVSCNTPAVCYVNGTFYMLFTGYESGAVASASMLATSTDGFNFTVYSSKPVLDDGASWINHHAESSGLSVFGGAFYYYYNVNPLAGITRNIGVATSSNCINWTVCSNNPVVKTTEGGYGTASNACVSMAKVVQYGVLNGQPEYLMLISASSGATSPANEHLDCLTSFTPMFNSTHYWDSLPSGAVFISSVGLDNPTPTVIVNSAGNTVPYNNSLIILYTDGTNARRTIYQPGGSLVNFVNWNRNNEVGTWTVTNGYLQEAGVSNSRAYLWSNLPSTAGYRAVANFSITSGQSYDSYLLARTTSGSSGGSGYALDIAQYANLTRIYKVTSGTWNLLASASYTPTSNIQAEFDVYGTSTVTLAGVVNGVQIITVSDSSSPIASGGFGLACADQPSYTSKFGNIYVTNYVNPEPVQGAWGNEESNIPAVSVSPTSWTMDVGQSETFTASASGGSSTYTSYQWYLDGSAQSGQTASTFNYSPTSSGSYSITVTVTDSLGATSPQSTPATVTVNSALVITASADSGGAISPTGSVSVNCGGSQSFTITANTGYYLVDVSVNGSSVGAVSSFTFTNVQTAYTISATFAPTPTPIPIPIVTPNPTIAPTVAPTPTPTSSPSPTPSMTTVAATTDSGATVDLAISGNITSSQMSNVTIATNRSATTTTVSFTVTGESGTTGFSNLTIPKSAIPCGTTPTIYISNQPAQNQGYTQDTCNYYAWYTTHSSTHQVSIVFTSTPNSTPLSSFNPGGPNQTQEPPSIPQVAIYGVAAAVALVAIVAVAPVFGKSKKGKN